MANFDLAFYHNSYPVENKESAMLTSSLKTLSKVVAVLESASFVYLGYKGYTFACEHLLELVLKWIKENEKLNISQNQTPKSSYNTQNSYLT